MAHISTELLTRIQNGDPEAAAELFQQYATQIRCLVRCLGFTGPARSARGSDDVQQDVSLMFHAAAVAGKFRGRGADYICNWLRSVTRKHLCSIMRAELGPQRGGGRVVGLAAEPAGSESGVGSEVARREKQELLRQALAKLEEKDRELLEDRYFNELGVAELAKKYGVSVGTISKRVEKAREKLRGDLPRTPVV